MLFITGKFQQQDHLTLLHEQQANIHKQISPIFSRILFFISSPH